VNENVVSIDLGVDWEPSAPEAVMRVDDRGTTALALRAHSDDDDQRAVVLVWSGSEYSAMSSPNDEARNGHRLYEKGLQNVLWAGQVLGSELINQLERQNSVHPLHRPTRFAGLIHHVILTKESTVEVVANSLAVRRLPGSTARAAESALSS
jgi:intracellular sulfur oxidation DsrE/DsrF family protein